MVSPERRGPWVIEKQVLWSRDSANINYLVAGSKLWGSRVNFLR